MSLSVPNNPPTVNPTLAKLTANPVFGTIVNRILVNQIHGVTVNNATGTGVPKQVTSVQVSIANAQTGSTSTVTVVFKRDSTDTTFSGVNIWVKGYEGNPQPVQVASGAESPCRFTLTNTGETVTFTIQAFGNGGNAPLSTAPTASAQLPKSTTGGYGTNTVIYYNSSNPPPATSTFPIHYHYVAARGDQVAGFPGSPGVFSVGAASNFPATATETTGRAFAAPATASTQGQIAVFADTGANPGQGFLSLGTIKRHSVRILPQVSSNVRYYVGILDNPTGGFGGGGYFSDTPNNKYVGFRFSSGTDSAWQVVAGIDNTHQSIASTGVGINTSSSTLFEIAFFAGGTIAEFFINGTLVGTLTLDLPSPSYNISSCVYVDNKNTATAQSLVFFWSQTIMTQ